MLCAKESIKSNSSFWIFSIAILTKTCVIRHGSYIEIAIEFDFSVSSVLIKQYAISSKFLFLFFSSKFIFNVIEFSKLIFILAKSLVKQDGVKTYLLNNSNLFI